MLTTTNAQNPNRGAVQQGATRSGGMQMQMQNPMQMQMQMHNPMNMMQDMMGMMQAQSRMMQNMSQMMFGGRDPFGDIMGGGFGGMGMGMGMGFDMPDISSMMTNGGNGNGSSMVFSSQQVFNSGDPGQCFSRTTATAVGPGGVVESRVQERDGRDGVERMGIRHQLGDRVHQVERERNLQTGEENEHSMQHGFDDIDAFEQEFQERRRAPATWGARSDDGTRLAIADRPAASVTASIQQLPPPHAQQPTYTQSHSQPPSVSVVSRGGSSHPIAATSTVERNTEVPPGYPPGTRVYYREVSSPQASSPSHSHIRQSQQSHTQQTQQPQTVQQTSGHQPRHHRDGSYW